MIFVTVGTHTLGFERLVAAMDQVAMDQVAMDQVAMDQVAMDQAAGGAAEEVVIQLGATRYRPRCATWFTFAPSAEIERLTAAARVVVSHAGAGAILLSLRRGKPLVVYARLRGLSWQETVGGSTHGYWDFGGSRVMARLYPWLLWIDAVIYAALYVYAPRLLGRCVVCDRFVLDTLADLMTALDDEDFDLRLPGRLFPALIPRAALVIVLDLDFAHAVQRNPELAGDRTWPLRRRVYQAIARHQGLRVISTAASVEGVTERILSAAIKQEP